MRSTRVLGVRVDAVTLDEAARIVLEKIEAGRARAGGGRFWLVVTPNPEIVMAARSDPELGHILNQADLAVPDGIGLVWAARRQGLELSGRVAGCDLLSAIVARGARIGLRVFFLGAKPGVAAQAAQRLGRDHPGLEVVGAHHGYFPASDDARIAGVVAAAQPELVVVAMGSPRQEKWLTGYRRLLEAEPSVGGDGRAGLQVGFPAGGSLDVLSGQVKRAPAWAARLNLEWAVRVASQPSRWRRAPALVGFVLAVLRERRPAGERQG
jgi:N-acetylglucosaminyldiphosphoundecaprenol N-acetyl-beta-D-mannosaminyltransferase